MEEIVVYPVIYTVLYIPGGAGFLPSTVCLGHFDDFWNAHFKGRHTKNSSDMFFFGCFFEQTWVNKLLGGFSTKLPPGL